MAEIIYLKDYMLSNSTTTPERKISLNETLTQSPLHIADDSLFVVRNKLVNFLGLNNYETLLMPVASDMDPFWVSGCPTGWFNASFPGYSVMHTVIRDYPSDFVSFVDGYIVDSQLEHDRLVDGFNDIYIKALKGKGTGEPKGTLGLDQFIRMGCLFYLLLKTSDLTKNPMLNSSGIIASDWCGTPKAINVPSRQISAYSARLKKKFFASCSWDQFVFRGLIDPEVQNPFWLFNLTGKTPTVEEDNEFDISNIIQMFDFFPIFSRRGQPYAVVMDNTEFLKEILGVVFDLQPQKQGISGNPEIILDTHSLGNRYMIAHSGVY